MWYLEIEKVVHKQYKSLLVLIITGIVHYIEYTNSCI